MPRPKKVGLKTVIPFVVLLIVVGAIAYAAWPRPASTPNTVSPTTDDPYLPKAEEGKSTQPSANASPGSAGTPSPIPTSSVPQSSKNGEISITSPTQGATITSGTMVKGAAKTTASRIYYRVKGGKSGQLALGSVAFSGSASVATPFSFELAFTDQVSSGGDQGVVEVFTLAADGSEQTIASVTVNISES
jgi:hypothetical protein